MAQSLLSDGPYGDPWGQGTGASAWLTPIYPAVVALCMKLGGGVAPLAATWLFAFQALLCGLTALAIRGWGRMLSCPGVGRLAAWAFVFYPLSIWHASQTVWDTTLAAAGCAGFISLLLRVGAAPSPRLSALIGAAYGGLLLINPAPLAIAPAIALYLAGDWRAAQGARVRRPGRATLARLAAWVAATLLVCGPWCLRNQLAIGTVGLRSNLGVELRVGNNDLADSHHQTAFHPSHTAAELERYREMGEVAYSSWSRRQAFEWIAAHPARFGRLTVRRVRAFWVGEPPWSDPRPQSGGSATGDPKSWLKWVLHAAIGILALLSVCFFARGTHAGRFMRMVVLLYPLPYCFTHVSERYRFPMDPLLVFLGVWGLAAAWGRWQESRKR